MRTWVLVSCLLIAPGLARAYVWEGIWAVDPQFCAAEPEPGGGSDFTAIHITASDLGAYDEGCEVARIFRISDEAEAWQVETICQIEDQSFSEFTWLMMASPDKLWRWSGSGDPTPFFRCGEM